MINEEQEYLKTYDYHKYEKPSIAADIAILSIMEEEGDNYRKDPKKHLKILLIKRGKHPCKDQWAVPGGFLKSDETLEQAAERELLEETGVSHVHLEQVCVLSDPGRDPRGWILSDVFMALVDGKRCKLHPANDAKEAEWFTVELKKISESKENKEREIYAVTRYELSLSQELVTLRAVIDEKTSYSNYRKTTHYEIVSSENIAFDHAKIIMMVVQNLRDKVNTSNIAFDMMPEYFTLTELQRVYEVILDTTLLAANFRRKIAGRVVETDKISDGAGHRPAKLFTRNLEAFYEAGK